MAWEGERETVLIKAIRLRGRKSEESRRSFVVWCLRLCVPPFPLASSSFAFSFFHETPEIISSASAQHGSY